MKKTTLIIWFVVLFGVYIAYEKFSSAQQIIPAPSSQTQNVSSTSGSVPPATTSSPPPNTATASSASAPATKPVGMYKDGTYTGPSDNAYWGNVKVQAVVQGGKLTNVTFLKYPNSHPASVYINSQVMPYLTQEAIQAQSANVNIVSGATFTSQAFIQSLASALTQAKNS